MGEGWTSSLVVNTIQLMVAVYNDGFLANSKTTLAPMYIHDGGDCVTKLPVTFSIRGGKMHLSGTHINTYTKFEVGWIDWVEKSLSDLFRLKYRLNFAWGVLHDLNSSLTEINRTRKVDYEINTRHRAITNLHGFEFIVDCSDLDRNDTQAINDRMVEAILGKK